MTRSAHMLVINLITMHKLKTPMTQAIIHCL